jgi:hypothetical protein
MSCANAAPSPGADSRGNLRARDRFLRDYFGELERQVHKTLTRKNATTMIYLTIGFFEVVVDGTPRTPPR